MFIDNSDIGVVDYIEEGPDIHTRGLLQKVLETFDLDPEPRYPPHYNNSHSHQLKTLIGLLHDIQRPVPER